MGNLRTQVRGRPDDSIDIQGVGAQIAQRSSRKSFPKIQGCTLLNYGGLSGWSLFFRYAYTPKPVSLRIPTMVAPRLEGSTSKCSWFYGRDLKVQWVSPRSTTGRHDTSHVILPTEPTTGSCTARTSQNNYSKPSPPSGTCSTPARPCRDSSSPATRPAVTLLPSNCTPPALHPLARPS